MRLFPLVLASACTLTTAAAVRAETVTTRLTPAKPGDNLWSFTVKAERHKDGKAGEQLEFRVTAKPKDAKFRLPRRTGTLEVFAGKEVVSSCDVRPTESDGTTAFTFRVAAKFAAGSRFTFSETADPPHESQGFHYWFDLADFTEPGAPAAAPLRIENGVGFASMTAPKFFRDYWGSLPDDAKLFGKLSDHLTRERIASVVTLEMNGAIALFFGPGGVRSSLDDELDRFLSRGGRFHTGRRLPDGFEDDRPPKHKVLLFRTTKGEYGLLTFYSGFVVVELNRRVGVVLDEAGGKK